MDILKYYPSHRGLLKIGLSLFIGLSDSDICMVESDAAETLSAEHDKLHLQIQPDSSSTN